MAQSEKEVRGGTILLAKVVETKISVVTFGSHADLFFGYEGRTRRKVVLIRNANADSTRTTCGYHPAGGQVRIFWSVKRPNQKS